MSRAEPKDGLRVLSFDGPPFPEAALSKLFFLQQIAHRWAFTEDDDDGLDGDEVRVSDMFDIIGGCGLGGINAILFARLNMTVGQVIQFHKVLIQKLFTAACWNQMDHQECAKVFNNALDQMVSQFGIAVDLNSPFLSRDYAKCFVVVLNKTKANTPSPRLLRSYRVRVDPSPLCTIRQALHATLADLEHLPAVTIDDEHFIRSSDVFPNPSRILMKDLAANFPKLHLACLVNVGVDWTDPPNDSYTVGQDLMAQFRNLGCFFRLSLRDELGPGSQVRSLVMAYLREDAISKMCDDIVDAIQGHKPVVNMLRLGDFAGEDGKHALRADISQLRNDGEIKRALEKLSGPFDFPSLHEHGCLEGTRVDVLEHIETWAKEVNAPNVFWLEGYPGTGKTFISISLKQRLAEAGLLGASCFFRREDASHHRLDTLVRSIAFQLADKHEFIQDAVVQAVNSGVVTFEGAPASLFTRLIYEPLTTTCATLNKCFVIVIDAMDEFGRSDADQQHLLSNLLPRWTQMPPYCKLFIASRSQGILPQHLDLPVHVIRHLVVGDEASKETINDIRTFLKHSFENIQNNFNSSAPLVTNSQLETLVKASSGLFIWASTVVQMVKQKTLRSHAKRFLHGLCTQQAATELTRMQPLYKLYRTVLEPLLNTEESKVAELPPDELLIKSTFFSALARARVPLSADALASLCKADVEDIQDIVLHLTPVIDSSSGLRFLHESFADYVTSQDFPILLNFDAIELIFVTSCFKIMLNQLHFNMGKMPSSYMLNSDIPTLQEALSEELRYASRFWGSHLKDAMSRYKETEIKFTKPLDNFLNHQFLYWVEVMSILGRLREATEILSHLKAAAFEKEVNDFAQDALAFFGQFALPISQSYPHTYISAIPWTPASSLIRTRYLDTVSHALRIVSNGGGTWPAQLDMIKGHDGSVVSVAFSPDGSQIVSGSDDSTIRIWDAATRQPTGEPIQIYTYTEPVLSERFAPNSSQIMYGSDDNTIRDWSFGARQPGGAAHLSDKHSVTSVAFSPDGSQIVSGLKGHNIRIWDSATRQPSGEPLRGHTNSVTSVAFSPDGFHIVSGSKDKTIQIWDVASHLPIGEPLRGHNDSLTFVAFSSDSSQIVSGSDDNTIRIWDAATHQPIGKPIHGYNGWIFSVACSPNGSQIVSGCNDGTIRIWDAATRQPIGPPLQAHNDSVISVAFSPDGSQIVSGSSDKTIRIWDAATFQPVGEILRGHHDSILSVAFSPDGSQVVSGSNDRTIRIWDADARQPSGEPLRGHINLVFSVAFSPDGSQIIGGANDNTIQIWDAATLQPIGEPLRGHANSVTSVAFSSDGFHIVSGSKDRTIRIWDAASRRSIGEPLQGHNKSVNSVAFSPDGSQIISGSDDNTIWIWDAATHQPIGEPLRGHHSSVTSVAISPDSSQIVSGSNDNTIRMWDATTRRPAGGPLRGHTNLVRSVAFSPDGSQIVSGSSDRTIRVWDAVSLQPIGEPLHGHTHLVNSVIFSPDGSQIISGSFDKTIRIWDATTRQPIGEPLRGHSGWVFSVAFSLNGSQIVSGSSDKTIRIWDAGSHCLIGHPIQSLKILSFNRGTHATPLYCFLLHNGWVVDQHNHRLVWIPHHHLHDLLPTPGLIDIIGPRRMIVIDASDMRTGTKWSSCVNID